MEVDKLSYKERQAINRVIKALKLVRKLSPELGIQTLHVFLEIAKAGETTSLDLQTKTGLSQSSCSRNLAALSELHRRGKPGLNLVKSEEEQLDRRRKLSYLTPEGVQLAKEISKAIK